VIGLAGATLVSLPLLLAGNAFLVQSSDSYDAFYYVSVSGWLTDHSILSVPPASAVPVVGVPAPVFGPAMTSITTGLRVGQELVQAGVTSVIGVAAAPGFAVVTALWVALIPGGVWVFGEVFGLKPWARAGLGVASVVSVSLVTQVMEAKAASVLGIALVPLAAALVAASARPVRGYPAVPPLLAAVAVTGLVGTYTEFAPFMGLVLICLVLIGPLRTTRAALVRAVVILLLALAVSPVIWWRAWVSLTLTAGVAASGGNAESLGGRISGLLGPLRPAVVAWRDGGGVLVLAAAVVVVVIFLVLGLVLGLVPLRTRGLATGILLAGVVAGAIAARGNDYVTSRASAMVLPLVLLGGIVGWAGFRLRVWRAPVRTAGFLTAVVLVAVLAVNVRASAAAVLRPVPTAFVAGSDMTEAAAWAHGVATGRGRNISVATAQLFDQLWMSALLVDLPRTSYLSLRGDLGYRGVVEKQSYWNGDATRFVLVGPGGFTAGGDGVVERNGRYRLVDLRSDADAAIVLPVQVSGRLGWQAGPHGEIGGVSGNELVLMAGGSGVSDLVIRFADVQPGTLVTARQGGRSVASGRADSTGRVQLSLSGATTTDGVCVLAMSVPGDGSLSLAGLIHEGR
jgi:hypothetical protein